MSYYTSSYSIGFDTTSTLEMSIKASETTPKTKAVKTARVKPDRSVPISKEPKYIPNPDYGKTTWYTKGGFAIDSPKMIPNPKYVPKDDNERFLLNELVKGNRELRRYARIYGSVPISKAETVRPRRAARHRRYELPKRFAECENIRKYFVKMTGNSNAVFRIRGVNLRPVTINVSLSARTINANFPLFPGREVEMNSLGLFVDGLAVANDGVRKQKDNLKVSFPVRKRGIMMPFYTEAVGRLCEDIAKRL